MDYNNTDVIIARATPLGRSALAVIRLSGPNLSSIVKIIAGLKKIQKRYAYLIQLKSPYNQQIIDTCILIYYKGPDSFTGEDLVEISCHGGDAIANHIINDF